MRQGTSGRGRRSPGPIGAHGFTLIEVAAAVAVFSFLIVVVSGYYPSMARVARMGRNVTYAVQLADEEVEYIHSLGYDWVAASSFPGAETFSESNLQFKRTVDIAECSADPNPPCALNPDLKVVTVTVQWKEGAWGNRQRQVDVTTLVSRYVRPYY